MILASRRGDWPCRVNRRLVAVGGELHADAEALLLESGSRQSDLWGANYMPGTGPERCLELTAMINIRPGQGNRSMVVQDPEVASKCWNPAREPEPRIIERTRS